MVTDIGVLGMRSFSQTEKEKKKNDEEEEKRERRKVLIKGTKLPKKKSYLYKHKNI